ncbi:DUF1800 family protein [Vibrio agarivorans]|uniref:DUF1800 family protein n=1 Tax=Vibrio agarivorans TaxID=153622 RepID=UPI0025B59C76|nr:DUF1800 family protein [Vibrio agarivorans]MDN3663475.1 DUF1800 family protein [Vibrio agarivorans]
MQTLNNKRVQQLLLQATMGFKSSDVERVQEEGSIESWIDSQVEHWRTSLVNRQNEMQKLHDEEKWTDVHFNVAYTDMLINRNDILRHRVSYVLTQLFVVSKNDPELKRGERRIAFSQYYDILSQHCFGDFEALLFHMATSPVMGQYLTYLNNDHIEGVAPDENFARELMQLFTIGPAMLNNDGTIMTDDLGRPVPSYSQQDIEEGAKVMTGWGLHNDDWLRPMREKDDAHNLDKKTILGKEIYAGGSAEEDLKSYIRILCEHDNIAPFVAKFFIQKMVSSNPSKDFVQRVSNAFRSSDLNMTVLLKAILTDHEASYSREDATDGLIRDPLIVLSHAFRALNLTLKPQYAMLPNAYSWHDRRTIMHGPSVFYYYQPEEAPNDPRFTGLAAPEFKLYNWDDIYHYFRQVTDLAVRLESQSGSSAYMNRPAIERHFADKDNTNSIHNLINELDKHLFAKSMSEKTKDIIYEFVSRANRNNDNVLRALITQLILSPEFMTQG